MKRDQKNRQWIGTYAGQRIAITDDGEIILPEYDGYSNLGLNAVQVEAIVMMYAWRNGISAIDAKFDKYLDSMEANDGDDE